MNVYPPHPRDWQGQIISSLNLQPCDPSLKLGKGTHTLATLVGQVSVLLIRERSTLPVIFDELRPLVGLERLGTLRGIWQRKRWIIYPLLSCLDFPINPWPEDLRIEGVEVEIVKRKIQAFFLLRDLLSIKSYPSSVRILRMSLSHGSPGSDLILRGIKENLSNDISLLTNSVIEKWFIERPPDIVLMEIFGVTQDTHFGYFMNKLREHLSKTVERIDPSMYYLVNSVTNRFTNKYKLAKSHMKIESRQVSERIQVINAKTNQYSRYQRKSRQK